jgi:tetratricopeptide (TPR) repeat protein
MRAVCIGSTALGLLITSAVHAEENAYEGAAFPQCAQPAKIESDMAAASYKNGREFFEKRMYTKALQHFFEAYQNDCQKHEVLMIVSRAYEGAGNFKDAIRALRTFLERKNPAGDDRAQVEQRISSLEGDLKKQEAEAARLAALEAEKQRLAAEVAAGTSMEPLPKWLLIGGAGGAVVGVAFHAIGLGSNIGDSCSRWTRTCGTVEDQTRANASSASAMHTLGWVFLGAGAAAAGTGLVLHLTRSKPEAASPPPAVQARLSPAFAPGYSGMQLAGSF